MDTTQSHYDSLVFEKRKRLFFLSFDLNDLENKKAMKEYGIENVGGLFTKLFETGIHNFSELLTKYHSADSILIPYFGKSSVARLNQYLYELDLAFGMDMSPYVGEDLS